MKTLRLLFKFLLIRKRKSSLFSSALREGTNDLCQEMGDKTKKRRQKQDLLTDEQSG